MEAQGHESCPHPRAEVEALLPAKASELILYCSLGGQLLLATSKAAVAAEEAGGGLASV